MRKNKNYKRGFTLIEILVVILIIGILAAIALPQYQMAVMKSRYATLIDMVRVMYDAEQRYYMVHDKYAPTFEGLDIDLSGCTLSNTKQHCDYDWGYCDINISSSRKRLHCQNTKNLNNAYVYYFDSNGYSTGAYCWAFTSKIEDKWNRLCKEMGAKYFGGGTCSNVDACKIYKF